MSQQGRFGGSPQAKMPAIGAYFYNGAYFWHNDAANMVFCDGHAFALKRRSWVTNELSIW